MMKDKNIKQRGIEKKLANEIMDLLTKDGINYETSKNVLSMIQLKFENAEKNFLNNSSAKEVLKDCSGCVYTNQGV